MKLFAALKNGLENALAGIGTSKDKASHGTITRKTLSESDLKNLYANWLSRNAINIPVEDSVRKWRNFEGLDRDQIRALTLAERRLRVKQNLATGMKRGRNFGGALVFMGIDGAGDASEELLVDRVGPDSLKYLRVIDKEYVKPGPVDVSNPTSVMFMRPEYYEMKGGTKVHASRVLRFDGMDCPDAEKVSRQFWTTPLPEIIYDALYNVQVVMSATCSLVHESKIDIIKVEGLGELANTEEGEELIRKRFALADKVKSLNNMLLLDGDEEFLRNEYTFAGLDELLTKYLLIASSASGIPATKLLGQAASGLNATGEGDMKNYYDLVRGIQEDSLAPELDKLDEVLLRSALGIVPEDYEYDFAPLEEQNEKEVAETEKLKMETRVGYRNAGAIPDYAITATLVEEGGFSEVDDEYVELLKEIDDGGREPAPTDDGARREPSVEGDDEGDDEEDV